MVRLLVDFWRLSCISSARNGRHLAEHTLQRNVLYRISVFLGATRPSGPTEEPPDVHQLEYLPLSIGDFRHFHFLGEAETKDCDLWDGFLWAVPKKRTSHSKKRLRMTNKWLKPICNYTVCPKCQNLKLLHVLCGHCFKETMRKTAEIRRMKLEQQQR